MSPAGAGVSGSSSQGDGVFGVAQGPGSGDFNMGGVFGLSTKQFVHGVVGVYQGGDNQMAGVFGRTSLPGSTDPFDFDGASFGVLGISGGTGVQGKSVSCSTNPNCGQAPGVEGISNGGPGVSGSSLSGDGVLGSTVGLTSAVGVRGIINPAADDQGGAVFGDAANSGTAWAGNFVGDVQARGYYNSSDARLKKDIKEAPYGTPELMRLRPVSYKWKQGTDVSEHNGLLAQEVQNVFPAAVHSGRAGTLSVDYISLLPVVIKTIQQQQALIERQEARIAALEGGRAP